MLVRDRFEVAVPLLIAFTQPEGSGLVHPYIAPLCPGKVDRHAKASRS